MNSNEAAIGLKKRPPLILGDLVSFNSVSGKFLFAGALGLSFVSRPMLVLTFLLSSPP
jgi:hypothetical protein